MQKCKGERARASNSSFISSQSAMEYLMTYGWAILIIAIVLVALFSLGVFNSSNFSPRAQPGSCEVLRNSVQTSLGGQCNGMLPEYVAQFNGQSSYVTTLYLQKSVVAYTVVAWIKTTQLENGGVIVQDRGSGAGDSLTLGIGRQGCTSIPVGAIFWGADSNDFCSGLETTNNYESGSWEQIVGTWSAPSGTQVSPTQFQIYVNGVPVETTTWSIGVPTSSPLTGLGGTIIGFHQAWNIYFGGSIANIQIYNTSLSAPEIQALYKEGIGGAPIDLQNLVGWWPLNGNANDYSGNGNEGTATSVTYTSAWTSGYSAP